MMVLTTIGIQGKKLDEVSYHHLSVCLNGRLWQGLYNPLCGRVKGGAGMQNNVKKGALKMPYKCCYFSLINNMISRMK